MAFFRIGLFLFFSIFSLHLLAANEADDDAGIEKQKVYQVNDDISLIPTVKYNFGKAKIVVKSVYPKLISLSADERVENFNQLVADLIQEEVESFRKEVADAQSYQKNLPKQAIKNDLNIDFDAAIVNTKTNPLISIRFNIHGYMTGMTNAFHRHRVLNYDMDAGHELELTDLFNTDSDYLTFLADYSTHALTKKLKNKRLLLEGAANALQNYKNWNINVFGLLITFDKNQVAPSIYGTQTVLIPYNSLKRLISPDSSLGICLKRGKKCLRNNLLTGGFGEDS